MNWSERAFLTRWQLALIVLLLFAAVGTSIAVGITAVDASRRANDSAARLRVIQRAQQQSRVQAIEDLCGHDNANARHNVEFLKLDVKASRALVAKAKARFKQTPNCHAFAVRAANTAAKATHP
jgi:type II secretory pathway pseudopilin PulG